MREECEASLDREDVVVASSSRGLLIRCSALHLATDALSSGLLVVLPGIAATMALSLTQVGLVRSASIAAGSVLQVPAAMLGARFGEYRLLIVGAIWLAIGFMAIAVASSFDVLLVIAIVGSLGGCAQHPLGTSLIATAAPLDRRASWLGALNFAGDLGKVAAPALALGLAPFGWRATVGGLGAMSLMVATAAAVGTSAPRRTPTTEAPSATARSEKMIARPIEFLVACLLSVADASSRAGAVVLLPFLLVRNGYGAGATSGLMTLLFLAGAFSKVLSGRIADRFGDRRMVIVTQSLAVALLFVSAGASRSALPALIVAFGFVLNGTSSALASAVADYLPRGAARGYAVFYTLTLGAIAIGPPIFGHVSDRFGLSVAMESIAISNVITIPLALWLPWRHRRPTRA